MIVLALDTTAVTATAALCDGEKRLGEFTVTTSLHHSETMLPMIQSLLKCTEYSIDDVEIFAASDGPGSFTGVRIGASVLLGLAFEKNIPCVGVSSLEALAYNMHGFGGEFIACPAMDARRGQLYNALFHYKNGVMSRLCDDRMIMDHELKEELCKFNLPIYAIGDGAQIVKNAFDSVLLPPHQLCVQSAYSVAQTALLKYESAKDKGTFTDMAFKPVYLRSPQAERERNGIKE